jgi:hypothetical protein
MRCEASSFEYKTSGARSEAGYPADREEDRNGTSARAGENVAVLVSALFPTTDRRSQETRAPPCLVIGGKKCVEYKNAGRTNKVCRWPQTRGRSAGDKDKANTRSERLAPALAHDRRPRVTRRRHRQLRERQRRRRKARVRRACALPARVPRELRAGVGARVR